MVAAVIVLLLFLAYKKIVEINTQSTTHTLVIWALFTEHPL